MVDTTSFRLGPWTFVPSAHELRSGADRVRLEQRAATTLTLLCELRGQVVSHDQLIARGWNGRSISPNSVAIVIGDLRRALGLEAGLPGSIETVPKAGYRLLEEASAERQSGRSRAIAAVLAISILAGAVGLLSARLDSGRPEIAVGVIENATGSGRYQTLIDACNAQLLVALGKLDRHIAIDDRRGTQSPAADYVVVQRWVLWSGEPQLVLIVRNKQGDTIWTSSIYGPEDQFPAKIAASVNDLTRVLNLAPADRPHIAR